VNRCSAAEPCAGTLEAGLPCSTAARLPWSSCLAVHMLLAEREAVVTATVLRPQRQAEQALYLFASLKFAGRALAHTHTLKQAHGSGACGCTRISSPPRRAARSTRAPRRSGAAAGRRPARPPPPRPPPPNPALRPHPHRRPHRHEARARTALLARARQGRRRPRAPAATPPAPRARSGRCRGRSRPTGWRPRPARLRARRLTV